MDLLQTIRKWRLSYHTIYQNKIIGITPLLFDVSVLVNADRDGYRERYCYHNEELALKAIEHFKTYGEWKWYKKDNTNNITIVGKYAYGSRTAHLPDNALYEVEWDCNELAERYKHKSALQFT